MPLSDYAGAAVQGLATIGSWLGIGEGRQDRRQLKQQEALNDINGKTAQQLATFEQGLKYDMWDKTNYSAQLQQASKAGVSKAAAIGGSGTGTQGASVGNVGGGSAADAASAMQAQTGQSAMGLQAASQLALMKAQKDNIEADTANKKALSENTTTDTSVKTEELQNKQFENEINKLVGTAEKADAIINANTKLKAESGKVWNEYEAWKAAGFGSKENTDPNSPIAKAISAGMEQAVVDLKTAKQNGKLKEAETIVKQFEAKMAQEGLSPNSPWYVKFGADLLERAGINPLKK